MFKRRGTPYVKAVTIIIYPLCYFALAFALLCVFYQVKSLVRGARFNIFAIKKVL